MPQSSAGADHLTFVTNGASPPIAVHEWLPAGAVGLPVVCLPGLTRNARDFTPLAHALATDIAVPRRVIAIDSRGRGQSGYDPDPANYNPGLEAQDVAVALASLGIARALFVGTSRGGILTMLLAATLPGLVAGAVLNDIGARIEPAGLLRIKGYVGPDPGFRSWEQAMMAVKFGNRPMFPALDDARWERFTFALFAERDGRPVIDYDPNLKHTLDTVTEDMAPVDLSALFAALATVPTMVIHGELSDLLSLDIIADMTLIHPDLRVFHVPGEGHAPLLDTDAQIEPIVAFLAEAERLAAQAPAPAPAPAAT